MQFAPLSRHRSKSWEQSDEKPPFAITTFCLPKSWPRGKAKKSNWKLKKKALTIIPHLQVRNNHTAQIHTITSLPLYWTNITLLLSLLIAHQRLEFVISLVLYQNLSLVNIVCWHSTLFLLEVLVQLIYSLLSLLSLSLILYMEKKFSILTSLFNLGMWNDYCSWYSFAPSSLTIDSFSSYYHYLYSPTGVFCHLLFFYKSEY